MKSREERIAHINEMFRMNEPYSDAEYDRHYLGVVQHPKFNLIGFSVKDLLEVRKYLTIKNLQVEDLSAQ